MCRVARIYLLRVFLLDVHHPVLIPLVLPPYLLSIVRRTFCGFKEWTRLMALLFSTSNLIRRPSIAWRTHEFPNGANAFTRLRTTSSAGMKRANCRELYFSIQPNLALQTD